MSEELKLSIRQVRRLVNKAKGDGIKGLVHGLRGKTGNRAMAEKLMQPPEKLKEILCLKFICKVANDNTISRGKYFHLQLEPDSGRANWHRARVEVRIYPSGDIKVLHLPSGNEIKFKRAARNTKNLSLVERPCS